MSAGCLSIPGHWFPDFGHVLLGNSGFLMSEHWALKLKPWLMKGDKKGQAGGRWEDIQRVLACVEE